MIRVIPAILLSIFCLNVSAQDHADRWSGAGEYLPGLSISALMQQMAAEKKLLFEISPSGIVSGKLTTIYKPKAVIPNEGDQNFILTGKYDAVTNKLLLVITHFLSKPHFSESYLTFMKPDSVYYDVSVSKNGTGSVITGIANPAMTTHADAEWVGTFRGGGLSMDISGNNNKHILPLRIRFDLAETIPPQPVNAVAHAVYRDTATVAAKPERVIHTTKYVMERTRKIQRTITLDTSYIKLELYDNGEIDGDIVTLKFDGKTVISKQMLGAQAAVLYLNVSDVNIEHVLELYANNLGTIPPNTALVVLTCKNKRYEINLSSDETSNGAVKLLFRH